MGRVNNPWNQHVWRRSGIQQTQIHPSCCWGAHSCTVHGWSRKSCTNTVRPSWTAIAYRWWDQWTGKWIEIPWRYHGVITGYIPGWWLTYHFEQYEWVSSSVGRIMTFPTEWKVIKFHGSSHHQPDILLFQLLTIINHRLTIRLTRKIPWFQSPPSSYVILAQYPQISPDKWSIISIPIQKWAQIDASF